MPPVLCVIAFGFPVVPEENNTQIGCSNGTDTGCKSTHDFDFKSQSSKLPEKTNVFLIDGSLFSNAIIFFD